MRVAGVIPSRWGSSRFPGKSLALICGKPLVCRVVEAAKRASELDMVIVATDDERIRDACAGSGAVVVMTRPDHPSGTDRIAEAVAGTDAGIVVNIQGDEPLLDPGLIDGLAGVLKKDPGWDMATAAAPITDEADLAAASVVKVVWGDAGQALYFSRSVIPFVRDAGEPGVNHWRHVGIYAYRREFLEKYVQLPQHMLERAEKLEQLRALAAGARIHVLRTDETGIGVDTPDDVARVEGIMRARGMA